MAVDRWGEMDVGGERYRYNGKELVDEIGLYDYGARWYDPAVARWNAVDPLASDYAAWSTYNYVMGNPIKFIDPDGMRVNFSEFLSDGNGGTDKDRLVEVAKLIGDLKDITGGDFGLNDGFLVEKESTANKGSGEIGSGSAQALHLMRSVIHDPLEITVSHNAIKSFMTPDKPNHINFSPAEATAFKESLDGAGLDGKTYGLAMNFIHEVTHTKAGHKALGKLGDYPYYRDSGRDLSTPGRTGEFMNSIRADLKLAKRAWYPWVPKNRNASQLKWIPYPYTTKSADGVPIFMHDWNRKKSNYTPSKN